MKQNIQNIQMFQASSSLWSRFLSTNPQLFRELKGRLKTRNVVIAAAISVITQFVVVISFMNHLPKLDYKGDLLNRYGRYALGSEANSGLFYTKDLLDNWVINWQLFWLDIFITLSIISICGLLVIGTYLLVADVVKEEEKGTLNFIRLSPQPASNVLLGKILGVPVLLYIAVLLVFPLHLVSGLYARIPLTLITGFDLVVLASCALCSSLALFGSLINVSLSGFKPWLASGIVGFLLFLTTQGLFERHIELDNPFSWFFIFNPALVLAYLIDATHISHSQIDFLEVEKLEKVMFYGQALWGKAITGISFILFNLGIWTYWCWSILQRRFHNPAKTLIGKTQSYWLTGWLAFFALGFALQGDSPSHSEFGFPSDLAACFLCLQFYLYVWGMALIAALSPHRQALHDWARYRHQVNKDGNILWKELIFADNSPSIIAIAINLAIAITYITPSIFIFLKHGEQQTIFWGFILSASSILFCSLIAQLILTSKTRKRAIWSIITVTSMIIVPPVCLGFMGVDPTDVPQAWLFTLIPTVAVESANFATLSTLLFTLVGQSLAISLTGWQLTKRLKQAGASETQVLLTQSC